jgi:hypothetical protein
MRVESVAQRQIDAVEKVSLTNWPLTVYASWHAD